MTSTVKVAVFSVDPPGFTTFRTFDPESFTLISAVNDALIYIDNDGQVAPALATEWRRISPLEMEFTLRRGVRFHNGEPFDADSVIATFHAHRHPSPSAAISGVLGVITQVTKQDDFTIRLTTRFPDAMLLRRLFFSTIYPRGVLEQHGRDALSSHPIGTGPYRFVSYEPGREITLERNPEHWAHKATVDHIRLPILRQKEWIDRLEAGEIDVALGIDSHDRVRAGRIPGLNAASRQAAITQWFLLSQRGALADVRVRKALNHAVNRRLLRDVTEHGFGAPARSIATEGQQGYTECAPYRYSPELARTLLNEAGHASGLRLHGLVSETSTAVYFTVKEFLSRIGVELEAEIVPRSEWLRRVVQGHMQGNPYGGDFALAVFDNPILHTLFHHFIFLYSHGPFTLLNDPEYDQRFLQTATTFEEQPAREAQARLEHYARDQALVLFTVHEDVHAAWRDGFSCDLPRSGHFQVDALMNLRVAPTAAPAHSLPPQRSLDGDTSLLLEATSHAGAFYLRPGSSFEQPSTQRIWNNIQTSEERWRLQNEPMLRELVDQVEAKTNLANVLDSTERVAIVGYSAEGRRLFVNKGYGDMFGTDERSAYDHLGPAWAAIHAAVEANGSWLGPVDLRSQGRPQGSPDRLFLSVTRAVDEERVAMGYTFVFNDFSGEEERIRNQAIRTILDNVPYGLFMCNASGHVLEGYSDACSDFFLDTKAGIQGRMLTELLGMDARSTDHFLAGYSQIFDDFLPEEVSLGNLPERIAVGARTFSLSGSAVRGQDGAVSCVLFTLLDISRLIEAEHEIENLRGAVQVTRYRARFEDFALQLHQRLLQLSAAAPDAAFEGAARMALHTAKGVFGQFSLHGIAREIHALEDKPTLAPADLRYVDERLRELLQKNAALWDIQLERSDTRHSVTESALSELEASAAGAQTLAALQAIVAAGLERLRRKSVGELVGPLEESCLQQAARCGKKVRLELAGTQLTWPTRLTEVFEVLPHLIRNSIDHGIEPPELRAGKPEVATIRLGVEANDNGLRISIDDDGQGIAVERVARRALELGAISPQQLAAMPAEDQLQLIFTSGLSTAEQLTETSGRGVGMTAVKQAVEAMGGRLSLRSAVGRGTHFQIDFAYR
ncbi:MAG: GsiB: predicted glutathione-binding protein gsiB [Pseudomonadota bacterium]